MPTKIDERVKAAEERLKKLKAKSAREKRPDGSESDFAAGGNDGRSVGTVRRSGVVWLEMKQAAIQGGPACLFCELIARRVEASIIDSNELVLAVLDLRQFHPGHVLVMPHRHIPDVRALDHRTGTALMRMTIEMARAVERVFPSDGLSLWHSAGAGANQEVPHLHIHIHPRQVGDDLLRVYPVWASHPSRKILDDWALRLRHGISRSSRRRRPNAK